MIKIIRKLPNKKNEEGITTRNILKQDNKIKANIINEKPTDTINKLHDGLKKLHEQNFDNYILMKDLVNKTYNIENDFHDNWQ